MTVGSAWLGRFIAVLALLGVVAVIVAPHAEQEAAEHTATTTAGGLIVLTAPTATRGDTNATIVRVVDGDTVIAVLDAEPGERKIRLLGINTPETVDPRRPVECFGKEASAFAKSLLSGARVRLEADPEADERDKYDRLLRVIYMEDGRQFNRLMVEEGYASAYVSFPMSAAYKRQLKESEQDARIGERGLWSPKTCQAAH